MKVKIINNPSSGTKTIQKNLENVVGRLILNGTIKTVDKIDTTIDFDFEKEIQNANEYDLIIAVGGDGTVNNVINGMMKNSIKTPLFIIPAGTVNDLANYLNLPSSVEGICEIIEKHKVKAIDVCEVNDRYFINVAIAGLLSEIAINTPVEAKTNFGSLAYYFKGITEIPRQLYDTYHFEFKYNGEVIETDAHMFMVLNSKSAGGFTNFSPNSEVDDGFFDVCIIKRSYLLDAAGVFIKMFSGEHVNDPNVIYFQTNELEVKCLNKEGIIIDIDGEHGGELPAKFEIHNRALNIILNI